jgi:uncharacterized protein
VERGISFGGVVAFLFADLIVLPIINIDRKYYGRRMTVLLFALFYVAMAATGYIVEILFGVAGHIVRHRSTQVLDDSVQWSYITVLNFYS